MTLVDFIRTPRKDEELQKQIEKLNKDSAWEIISRRLKDAKDRSNITRRSFIEDSFDNAGIQPEEGAVENIAQRVEQEITGQQEEQESQQLPLRTRSAAENALRQEAYNESATQQQ